METTKIKFDISKPTLEAVKMVAERRGWTVERTIQAMIAAGMMAKAANYAGADVVGKMPDGQSVVISRRIE